MPYSVKTNVISDRVEILIAARTNDGTPVTVPTLVVADAGGDAVWKPVGTYSGGKLKVSTEEHSYEDQSGGTNQLGVTIKLEVPALETDSAKLVVLEGFIGKFNDVIFRVIGSAKFHRFNKISFTFGADMPFDLKNPNSWKVNGQVISDKVSSAYTTGTLA